MSRDRAFMRSFPATRPGRLLGGDPQEHGSVIDFLAYENRSPFVKKRRRPAPGGDW